MTTGASRMDAMEKRLQVLEDQEKIRECLARYGFNADLGRSQAYVDNYTEDGVIDLGPTVRYTGRRQLLEDFISGWGHKRLENKCLHTSMTFFIRVNGSIGWAEGYSVVLLREGDAYKIFSAGYNHWDFEKKGDRWFLKYRYRRPIGGDEWGGKVIKAYLKE